MVKSRSIEDMLAEANALNQRIQEGAPTIEALRNMVAAYNALVDKIVARVSEEKGFDFVKEMVAEVVERLDDGDPELTKLMGDDTDNPERIAAIRRLLLSKVRS